MARDTRQAILEATLHLLEEGDGDFTYESVAGRAGVARQTLYSQFPDRTELLVAAVDHARDQLGTDTLAAPVYEAPTARDSLDALLDFHIAYTPKILRPSRAIEAQRAKNPELSRKFEQRPRGRRQIARHVINRLAAEGDLDESWSVDEATDFVSALMTASFTSDLIEERHWSPTQLRSRLFLVIQSSMLSTPTKPATATQGGNRMTTDPTSIAEAFYATIQDAWNRGDGAAYGSAFGADTEFVDVRGVRHHGGPDQIGADHQGIFDSIYKGSAIRYDLERARMVGDDVILANGRATLDAPEGPLAGIRHAVSSVVLILEGGEWRAIAFHNTLVTA